MEQLANISLFNRLQESGGSPSEQSFDDPVGVGGYWFRYRPTIRIPYAVRRLLGLPGSEHNVVGAVPASVVAAYKILHQSKYKNSVQNYNAAYTNYIQQSNKYKHIYANAKLKGSTTPEMDDLRDDIVDCDYCVKYFNDMLDHNKALLEYCK